MPADFEPPLRWDLFCRVIDNHGDLGVCWRLAAQLAAAGDRVCLWVDDASALAWMAPQGLTGVELVHWNDPAAVAQAAAGPAPDVLVEAFGCDPAPERIARFAHAPHTTGRPHAWLNLEYLSAEPYVERLHGLPSPVFRGPGEGLTKHFFYPGFTPATGSLLREPGLAEARAAFDRADWLQRQGIEWRDERLVSLFCYEPPALPALLQALAADPVPTRLLVTPGRATAAVQQVLAGPSSQTGLQRPADGHSSLSISYLPALPQTEFDRLLWACDLNFVRGEDSFVRAHWAGAPVVWQIYPQDDDAHHTKLNAWLDWLGAPPALRQLHHAWNGLPGADFALPDAAALRDWQALMHQARHRLCAQDDLVTQLRRFAIQKS